MVMVDLPASEDTGSYNNDVKRSKTSYARRLELQVCGGGGGGAGRGEMTKGRDMARRRVASLPVAVVAMAMVCVPAAATTTLSPSDNVDDPLMVGTSSHHCNWTRAMGPVCVYNTTSQVVVVPEGLEFSSGQLELEIHDPSVVQLYPTCVSWIQVYNAGEINTLPAERNMDCRTWLRVYNSKAGRIEYGVKDLTLLNSEVETIKLFDQRDFMAINSSIREIEELDWGGYRATVLNTSIGRLSGVQARDSWYVLDGRFGSVATGGIVFNAREMSVINSTIKHMSAKSLTIKKGTVTFANVSINYLEALAIMVSSPIAYLSLNNITIGAANAPCFVLLDRDSVSLTNVTVLGIPINESSPFLHFLEDSGAESSEYLVAVSEQREECVSNETSLSCDFIKNAEKVEIREKKIRNVKQVEVRNANSLLVTSMPCKTELRLKNVNATLPHFAAVPGEGDNTTTRIGVVTVTTPDNTTTCNVTVVVSNSSLNVVWARHMKSLNVKNSSIKRIHGGRLDGFVLAGSTVEEMDGVEVVGRGAHWSRSSFPGSISVTLKAPLESSAINLLHLEENSLIIDHPGETTTVTGWRLGWMRRRSIVVKNGSHVELSHMMADRIVQEAIYLEEGASASAKNFHTLLDSINIFSVARSDQLDLKGFTGSKMYHVRALSPTADHQSNYTVSDTHISAYCRSIPYYLQICDFSTAPQGSVTVDLADGQVSNRVIIKGASSVKLFPSCVEKIILMNVKEASTVESDRDCGTWLEAFGVHLTNVTFGVHDVTLKSCTVDLLAPDRRLRDVDLEGSSVSRVVGVHWAGYTGVFNNSRLGEVRSLRADSRLMMSNSTVEKVVTGGMFLAAEAIIAKTTFKEIQSYGITVNQSTRMQDVIIEKLDRRGINVLDGLLLLVNVRILKAEHESITAEANGGISFQNVTVEGKKVHWRGYLTTNNSSLKQSVIFLNKLFNGTEANVTEKQKTSSTTTTTTTPARPSPQASSRVQWRTTNSGDEAISSEAPNPLEGPAPSSSWKWAGAGIGFCMGLVVGCCIFIAVKVIKPNKGMLTLPTVFWRVKDDHHELLQEEQAVEDPPVTRRDQGYTALPRSDV